MSPGVRTAICLLAGTLCLSGRPALGDDPAPPVVDASIGARRSTEQIAALVARAALAPDRAIRVEELGRDADTSHHLVSIREREPLHRHDRHALLVVMLKGHGAMQLGREERPVGPGSILYVPRGAAHAFINRSGEPAVAYVVYTPPYDGADRQLVE